MFLMMVTNLFIAPKYDVVVHEQCFSMLSRGYGCTLRQIIITKIVSGALEKDYKLGRSWRCRSYDHNPENWLVKVYHFDIIDISYVVNLVLLEKLNLVEVYLDCFCSQFITN